MLNLKNINKSLLILTLCASMQSSFITHAAAAANHHEGEKVLSILSSIAQNIPQAIADLKNNKCLEGELAMILIDHYSDCLTFSDLSHLQNLTKQDNISKGLEKLLMYIALESILTLIESRLASLPGAEKARYINLAKEKIEAIKTQVLNSGLPINITLDTPAALLPIAGITMTPDENRRFEKIIDGCQCDNICKALNVNNQDRIAKLKQCIKNGMKVLLSDQESAEIEQLLTKDKVIRAIIQSTNKTKIDKVLNGLANLIINPAAKDSINECRQYLNI